MECLMAASRLVATAWAAGRRGSQRNPNPPVDAFFVFAPAETNPSAIAAGSLIEVPALVVSGTGDAVTHLRPNTNPFMKPR